MKFIIMVAGKGTRLHPITLTRPKPLIPLAGTTVLEHMLEQINKIRGVDEVILVIGYMKDMIRSKLAEKK